MANTFKSYTTGSVGTTLTNVHAVGASTSSIVLGCSVSNTTTSPIEASIKLNNNDGDNVYVVKEAPVPVGSSIEVMAGNKIALNTSDILQVQSDTATSVDVVLNVLEIT